MTIYVAKTTREAKIFGGGTKTKTQFHSVRAESRLKGFVSYDKKIKKV